MKELLGEVNELHGVKGSMVITHDGILAVSALGTDMDEEAVAALSSSLVLVTKRAFDSQNGEQMPEEMMLSAELGKLLLFDLGRAYLVVVTQPQLKLSTDVVDIRSVARRLRARMQLKV